MRISATAWATAAWVASAWVGLQNTPTPSTGPSAVNSTTSTPGAGCAWTPGTTATRSCRARIIVGTSTPCSSGTLTVILRWGWWVKLTMLSPNSRLLPTETRRLSVVSRVVANRPISCTMPVAPPAEISSPTRKGRSTSRKTPAAKLESSPDQAVPMAMPAAASSAANEVVSTPIMPRMASSRRMVREPAKSDSM